MASVGLGREKCLPASSQTSGSWGESGGGGSAEVDVAAGYICPDNEAWAVKKALYGFQASPSFWALHQDERFSNFEWLGQGEKFYLQPTKERNLWRIIQEGNQVPVGLMLVYVDDLGTSKKAHDGLVARIQQEWKTSKPEKVNPKEWVRFCGFEMKYKGEDLLVGQPSYLQDLFRRRKITSKRSTPLPKEHLTAMEDEGEIKIEDVRQAQAIAGEILWVAVRSRPDLSYAIGALGRAVTKNPRWALQAGYYILEYLNATEECFLAYGRCREKDRGPDDALARERSMNLVEIYCDVSRPSRRKERAGHRGDDWRWCCTMGVFETKLHGSVNSQQQKPNYWPT